MLNKTYGHKALFLYFYRGDEPVVLIPMMEVASLVTGRRGVSMPFSDFCEPLQFERAAWQPLVSQLVELARERKWRYFELRGGREALPPAAVAAKTYYGHGVDLTAGIEGLFGCFASSVRRAIRKAEKSDLRLEVASTRKAMLDFYQLHVRNRRRHGLPPQSLAFFLNIDQEIMRTNLGFIVLAKNGTRSIAAAVFFCSGKTALFKFGASDERSHELRANNLVIWEGIKQLVSKGLRTLHFGRTALNNDGLRRFKLAWGTKEQVLEYFRFAPNKQTWLNSRSNASELHNQFFRHLPLAANRIAGSLIYPHLD